MVGALSDRMIVRLVSPVNYFVNNCVWLIRLVGLLTD